MSYKWDRDVRKMASILIIVFGYILARYYRDIDEDVGMLVFIVSVLLGGTFGVFEIPLELQLISIFS